MDTEPQTELRGSFHHKLDEIRDQIVMLAAMVTEAIPQATQSLLDNDLKLAKSVLKGDDKLDLLSLEIEEECYRTIALQNPVASDMRTLVTDMKVNGEYERSGDLAANIAKGVRRGYGMTLSPRLRGLITAMNDEAVKLMKLSVDAYVERDDELASALADIDDRLDDLQTDFIEAIFEANKAGELSMNETVQLALISRFYERIGDHAVNIGERVMYMVTGQTPESEGAIRARKKRDKKEAKAEAAAEAAEAAQEAAAAEAAAAHTHDA